MLNVILKIKISTFYWVASNFISSYKIKLIISMYMLKTQSSKKLAAL